jgi:hypothetical protein
MGGSSVDGDSAPKAGTITSRLWSQLCLCVWVILHLSRPECPASLTWGDSYPKGSLGVLIQITLSTWPPYHWGKVKVLTTHCLMSS